MPHHTDHAPLYRIVADVLEDSSDAITATAHEQSFLAMGGDSFEAITVLGEAERALGVTIDLADLLGPRPLADVLGAAVPTAQAAAPADRELLDTQPGMLMADKFTGRTDKHLLSSAELTGPVDPADIRAALQTLTRRHPMLRTVFRRSNHQTTRAELPGWQPDLRLRTTGPGADPVTDAHRHLAAHTRELLHPTENPAVVWVLTSAGHEHHVLSMVVHHVLLDGWSIGLFWREFAACLAGEPLGDPAPTADAFLHRQRAITASGALGALTRERIAQLRGFPTVTTVPAHRPAEFDFHGARHRFTVDDPAQVEELAARAGVTRTAVLFAALAVLVGRAAGRDRLLIANSVSRRPAGELMRVLGPLSSVTPVACLLPPDQPVTAFLRATGDAVLDGIRYQDVDYGDLATALLAGVDPAYPPLAQVVFTANDQLVPAHLDAGPVHLRIEQGHCGGVTADLVLYVLRWTPEPLLALDYATSIHTAAQAAVLATGYRDILTRLHRADTLREVL